MTDTRTLAPAHWNNNEAEAWAQGYEAAERRIVEWLRSNPGVLVQANDYRSRDLKLADAIERGEHRV